MASRRVKRAEARLAGPPNKAADIAVGVVGLGLMGNSIMACLLAAGHPIVGVTRSLARRRNTRRHLQSLLREMKREKLLRADPAKVLKNLRLTESFADLGECQLVIETVLEDLPAKYEVFRKVELAVPPETIIGSNTSAIPATTLQKGAAHPERFMGIHWGEPAHVTRFMEIICGEQTDLRFVERARALAQGWGKEPSIVRRDIRGFLTNRCMYALMREAFHLVESGYATIEDVDRSLRNDLGYWMTLAGPFRFMDLTGVPAYLRVMKDLLPELCCSKEVPALIRKVVDEGGLGVANARGFYSYTPQEAKRWEKRFLKFSYDIRALAQKYPDGPGSKASKTGKAKS
ncbi:MAG: 3-hydroxyacyl-CoA dehydrogenase family protein [Terriglobia bacterium]